MAKAKTVWGIDIGQCVLKALKLAEVDGQVQVEAIDIVEHPKILSQSGVDSREFIRSALEEFLSRHDVTDSEVCVSVPGQSSFTRFVKLPPVEPKKIPDIVKFEGEQQIPFPIADVIWRWQTFQEEDSPDIEVGIFAMKRSDINASLEHFSDVSLEVDVVQMEPLALYNFMVYDEQVATDGATLLVDVGTDKTDLVVSDGARIWTRTIQIGGNNFTESLVKAFKLSFSKAEKLKRTAASSKYARQIFQAMRPVFADLVQEIQRSIGYFTSLHREARFKRLIGLGSGFRLPGLQKFLEQNLSIPVVRIDNYNKLTLGPDVNAPVFAENVLSFAVAYGLAVQGMGAAAVSTNLLPSEIARTKIWGKKKPWFGAAAAVLLVACAMPMFRAYSDNSTLKDVSGLRNAKAVVADLGDKQSRISRASSQGRDEEAQAQTILKLFEHRDYWPILQSFLLEGLVFHATDQGVMNSYATAPTKDQRDAILTEISGTSRSQRYVVVMEEMEATYVNDLSIVLSDTGEEDEGGFDIDDAPRGFDIRITGRTPLGVTDADKMLRAAIRTWKRMDASSKYKAIKLHKSEIEQREKVSGATGGGRGGRIMGGRGGGMGGRGGGMGGRGAMPIGRGAVTVAGDSAVASMPDPLFPDNAGEDIANDTRFVIRLVVSIVETDADED